MFEAAQATCTILLPYAVKQIIDAVTLANDTGADVFEATQSALILFGLLNLGIVLFSRASGAVLVMTGPRLRADIRKALFSYLQHHSHRYFISHFAGSLANRIAEVSMSSMHALWAITFDFYPLIIKSVVALIILFTASGQLALVLTLWLTIYVYVSYVLAKRCRVYAKDFAEARSLVTGKVVDSVTNVMNAKMFARRRFEEDYLTDYLNHEVDHALRTYWYMEKLPEARYPSARELEQKLRSVPSTPAREIERQEGAESMRAEGISSKGDPPVQLQREPLLPPAAGIVESASPRSKEPLELTSGTSDESEYARRKPRWRTVLIYRWVGVAVFTPWVLAVKVTGALDIPIRLLAFTYVLQVGTTVLLYGIRRWSRDGRFQRRCIALSPSESSLASSSVATS